MTSCSTLSERKASSAKISSAKTSSAKISSAKISSAPAKLPSAFNRLAWSNLAAQSAEQIGLAAAPIVAVLTLGAGAGATGVLQTAQTLPFLLLSIPAGVLADRASRRRLMAGAEALRALSLAGVLTLAHLNLLTLPLLALLGFIGACGTVAYSVASPALVPALVPAGALAAANGRIELARTVAFAGGPALATYGVGMVVGALRTPRIIRALPFGVVVVLGPIAGLAAAAVMVLTIWIPVGALAGVSFFLIGTGPIVWVISTATLRQTVTPRDLLGRASAINITAYGARPVGAALGALLGAVSGAETCLVVAAAGFLVQALVILASPVRRLERQPAMVG